MNNFSMLAPKEIVEKSMENMHVDVRHLRVKCMKLEILIGLVLFKGEILQERLSVFKMYFIQISFNYNFNFCPL